MTPKKNRVRFIDVPWSMQIAHNRAMQDRQRIIIACLHFLIDKAKSAKKKRK
jgi:hypothetical protein